MDYAKLERFARAGWRPALQWAIVVAVVIQYDVRPFFDGIKALDLSELFGLLVSGGGLAYLRSKEKKEGTAK